jgi:hypothetical protein
VFQVADIAVAFDQVQFVFYSAWKYDFEFDLLSQLDCFEFRNF